jgi:hypothetical protein
MTTLKHIEDKKALGDELIERIKFLSDNHQTTSC